MLLIQPRIQRIVFCAALASVAFGVVFIFDRDPSCVFELSVAASPSLTPLAVAGRAVSRVDSAGGYPALSKAHLTTLAAIYSPHSWCDALQAASSGPRDGFERDRALAWSMTRNLCLRDRSIDRAESQWVRRALATPEGRQSLAMIKNAAAGYCDGFDETLAESACVPFFQPIEAVDDPEVDLADELAATTSPLWYGNIAAGLAHRPVLPEWEAAAGISGLPPNTQERIRRVATLEAVCAVFPTGCGPGGLTTIAECHFDHRCRPSATAPQIMAERFGLDPPQQALASGLGRAMAADYTARRRLPGGP